MATVVDRKDKMKKFNGIDRQTVQAYN